MNLFRNRLLRASSHLTLATLFAGGLGYVFQVLMGRLLCDSEFAAFSSLNSLTMIVGSPLAALMMLIARRVARLNATNNTAVLSWLYRFWQTRVLGTFLVLGCILARAMPQVQAFVKTSDGVAVWLFWGVLAINALVLVNAAFLQGFQRFAWLGGLSVIIVALKIGIACGLIVAAEWGLRGALTSMMCAGFIIWIAGLIHLQRTFSPQQNQCGNEASGFPLHEVLSCLSATVGFAVLSQADVPLANRVFPPEIAAPYAAAAVLGKAVLYLPGGIALALFPMVAANEHCARSRTAMLRQALTTTALACGIVAIVFSTSGDFIIQAAYGHRYPNASGILAMYGWAMVPLALVFVLKNYFIASAKTAYSFLVGGAAFLLVVLLKYASASPATMLTAVGSLSIALCVVSLWMHAFHPPSLLTSDHSRYDHA